MATPELEEMLIRHEGLRLKPYKCSAGKLTIGIGRNIEDRGITEAEARMMLSYDIAQANMDALKFPWFQGLNQPRKDAILNMLFNMGLDRFRGFKRFIGFMANGEFELAGKEMMDSKWAFQVGDGPGNKMDRAEELSYIIKTGKYLKGKS